MTFLHSRSALPFIRLSLTVLLTLFVGATWSAAEDDDTVRESETQKTDQDDGQETPLSILIRPDEATQIQYTVDISGTLTTPTQGGPKEWTLGSQASFQFVQRQLESDLTGPAALRAARRYLSAVSTTKIGDDHSVETKLPNRLSVTQVVGTDTGLDCASVTEPLNRIQLDLLQMPFDPLFVTGLLPGRDVAVGDKWNADSWVVPCLVGVEATTSQDVSCELRSMNDKTAGVRFVGMAEGALLGSSSSVNFEGTMSFDRDQRQVTSLDCRLVEERTAGPVSPGIHADVKIAWTQKGVPDPGELPAEIDEEKFKRPLALRTPWRLALAHSRDWHVFNQTERVLMLRQIRSGALVSQCNISAGVVVKPGDHTPDADFRADVEDVIRLRDGRILREETIRDDKVWRIRHVQATATASDEIEIIQDHYLCTATSGEQFSMLFSHARTDDDAFGDEPTRFLDSLSVAGRRPALPFR